MEQSEEGLCDQTREICNIVTIINQLLEPEQTLIRFFYEQYVPDPKHTFLSIVNQRIPYKKHLQQPVIVLLASCFYQMVLNKSLHNQELVYIQECYKKFINICSFVPKKVVFLQTVRKCMSKLSNNPDLIHTKKQLQTLMQVIGQQQQTFTDILKWRITLSIIVIKSVLKRKSIKRQQLLKVMRKYKKLKKQQKISINTTIKAFCFLTEQFLQQKNDFYIYFELQLKQLVKQPLDQDLYDIIQKTLEKCSKTNKKINNPNEMESKVLQNPQRISFLGLQNAPKTNHTTSRRKFNKSEGTDKTLRKIDHLMKFQKSTFKIQRFRSSQRLSVAEPNTNKMSLHETTRLGWFKKTPKQAEGQPSMSKSGSFFTKRKRVELYKNLIVKPEQRFIIKNKNLEDEMYEIQPTSTVKCGISLEEILLGERKDQNNTKQTCLQKKVGIQMDIDFNYIQLTLLVIFNQEMAYLTIKITKQNNSYIPYCTVISTFCNHSNPLQFTKLSRSKQYTLQDLQNYVQQSVIYFEALQERVQRKVTNRQKEVIQNLMLDQTGSNLSEKQLLKVISTVDLIRGDFFWYYTKSSLINGSRIERRKNIDFQDLSAFAVCMSKFKSDYDSCLRQLIEVQNILSLSQTCLYLSHGRLIVYKQLVKINGRFYLEILTISNKVYASFKRINKKPYFQNTLLERSLLDLQKFQRQKFSRTEVDLRQIVDQNQLFIFFMKNIVENFIELKYYPKIATFLERLNKQQSQQYFSQHFLNPVINLNPQIFATTDHNQMIQIKPTLHDQISHLRYLLLDYCEAYNLVPKFKVIKKQSHVLVIERVRYLINQIKLRNGIRVFKIFKYNKISSYHLAFDHSQSQDLRIVSSYPYNRPVFLRYHNSIGNFVRKQKPQPFVNQDYNLIKFVVKIEGVYAFVSLSQSVTIPHCRIDLYFPKTQMRFATFFDDSFYIDIQTQQMQANSSHIWEQILSETRVDFIKNTIQINKKEFKLFTVLKQMQFGQKQYEGKLEIIQHEKKLHYLITNYQQMCLELGRIDQIPFTFSRSAFTSLSSHKTKKNLYNSLIIRLYCQIQTGNVSSVQIEANFFEII